MFCVMVLSGFTLALPPQQQEHLRLQRSVAHPPEIAALPLITPRHTYDLKEAPKAPGDDGLVETIDIEVRKAIDGAKIFGDWIPSLFTAQGIDALPGTVRQVTEVTLRSADATPAATPRELLSARQGLSDGICGERKSKNIESALTPNSSHLSSSTQPQGALEEGGSRLFYTLFGAAGRGSSVNVKPSPKTAADRMVEGETTASLKSDSTDSDVHGENQIAAKVASMVNRGCSDQEIIARLRFVPGTVQDACFLFQSFKWYSCLPSNWYECTLSMKPTFATRSRAQVGTS